MRRGSWRRMLVGRADPSFRWAGTFYSFIFYFIFKFFFNYTFSCPFFHLFFLLLLCGVFFFFHCLGIRGMIKRPGWEGRFWLVRPWLVRMLRYTTGTKNKRLGISFFFGSGMVFFLFHFIYPHFSTHFTVALIACSPSAHPS